MSYRRWYPSATTLGDGRVLVTSGGQTCLTCLADIPEIYDPATNKLDEADGRIVGHAVLSVHLPAAGRTCPRRRRE